MQKLFAIEPEVAGEWGANTVVVNKPQLKSGEATLPQISHLDYMFDVWLGDSILQCEACYIVTQELADALLQSGISGAQFDTMEVSTSELWEQLDHEKDLPSFLRLIPIGKVDIQKGVEILEWSSHDVCWGQRIDYVQPDKLENIVMSKLPYSLVITEKCLKVLKQHHLEHCLIQELVWPD